MNFFLNIQSIGNSQSASKLIVRKYDKRVLKAKRWEEFYAGAQFSPTLIF